MSLSNSFKKLFVATMSVAVTVVAFASQVAPAKADWTSQRLIKTASSSAVYLQDNGSRYVFVHALAYFSWFSDFSNVTTISQAEMQSIPLGGNVFVRPGTDLVQFYSGANVRGYDATLPVYVVGAKGSLSRVVPSNSAAVSALATAYGSNWSSKVIKLNDAFFNGYSVAGDYTAPTYPDGQLFQYAGDPQTYVVAAGQKRAVTSEAFAANHFQGKYIVTAPASMTFANGAALNSAEATYAASGNQVASGSTGTTGTGSASVSLDVSTPASTFVPAGTSGAATNVPFLSFKISAADAVTIANITAHRYGAGASTDYSNVYLYDGNTRLTLGRTVNSSTNTVSFNGLNLSIPAGSSKVLTLTADLSTTAGGNVGAFEIVSASDVTGPASVSGTFPVRGNLLSFTSANTGSLTITKTGAPASPRVGDANVLFSSFQLQAGSAEDLTVRRIALYQAGSVRSTDIKNLALYQAGNKVASASGVDSKNVVTFVFDTPFVMLKGDTKTFDVKGDVDLAARVGNTVQFYLDQNSDLYAIGNTYGYGVNIVNTGSSAYSSTYASSVTLTGAQLTTQFTGPASTEIAKNAQNVTLYTGKMAAGANIEVRKVTIVADASSDLGTSVTNIKLVNADTGGVLFGPADLPNLDTTGADTETLILNGPFTFTAGQVVNFKITANIGAAAPSDATIKVTLNAITSSDVRNLDSGINVATGDIVPSSALVGNTHTIRAAGVTVDLANSPSVQSYTRGTLQKDIIGLIVRASNAQSVQLRQVNMNVAIADNVGGAYGSSATIGGETVNVQDRVSTIQLYDSSTGTALGNLKSIDSSGNVVLDNLNLNIPAGQTKTLLARLDISNNATLSGGVFVPYRIRANVTGSTTDYSGSVTVVDSQGNTAAVTGPTGSVNGTPTTYIVVIGSGSLTAAPISDPDVQSKLVVGGSNNVSLAKFRFSATNEDITITKLKVQTDVAANVQGMAIVDGTTVYPSTGTVSIDNSGIAKFSGLNIVVPKDSQKTITVRVNTKTISGGATTGSQFKVSLIATDASDTDVEARGSATTLYGTDVIGATSRAGLQSQIYRSVPSIQTVTTGLNSSFEIGSSVKLYKFSIAADAAGDLEVAKIAFDVNNASDFDIASYVVYDVSSGSEQALNSASATATIVFSSAVTIPAGTTKTFELRAAVTNGGTATLGNDIITTQIAGGDVHAASGTYAALAATSAKIVWSDISAASHSATTSDWNNGFLVQTLPTTSFSKTTAF